MVQNRSEQLVGREGFAQLLRAEFTNFLRVRSYVTALLATAVAFVLVAFLSALQSHSGNIGNNAVPIGPDGEAVSDTYTFIHQSLTGDGSLTARVTSLSGEFQLGSQLQPGLAPWAKAGIILEPGTSDGTDYAAAMVTGSHGVRMQYNYTHDSPGLTQSSGFLS